MKKETKDFIKIYKEITSKLGNTRISVHDFNNNEEILKELSKYFKTEFIALIHSDTIVMNIENASIFGNWYPNLLSKEEIRQKEVLEREEFERLKAKYGNIS